MRLLIGGDLVPTIENADLFCKSDIESIFGKDLKNYWLSADYRIFNMECPITNCKERLFKNGPSLVAEKNCLAGILALQPSIVMLSNNHIMDACETGLTDFMASLNDFGIPYIGAGENISATNHTYIFESESVRVGIYVCCDYEFSIALKNKAGAHPFSLKSYEDVRRLKNETDYVIVIYHGGKEYYRYPSPELQSKCRAFVDAGAELVLCQHSHCIGSEEMYENGRILYGQGNFVFNKKSDDYWSTSLLVEVQVDSGFNVRYLPIIQTKMGTSLASGAEKQKILDDLEKRSNRISESGAIEKEFSIYSDSLITSYLYTFAGWNTYWAAVDRKIFKGFFIKKHYSRKSLAAMWNFIRTDAHREVVLQGLENLIK